MAARSGLFLIYRLALVPVRIIRRLVASALSGVLRGLHDRLSDQPRISDRAGHFVFRLAARRLRSDIIVVVSYIFLNHISRHFAGQRVPQTL